MPDYEPQDDPQTPPTPVAAPPAAEAVPGSASSTARAARKPLAASRRLGRIVAGLVLLWIVAVTFGAQLAAWVGMAASGTEEMGLWVRATWIEAALLAVPLLPLALAWRVPRYRAMFRTWLWATGYLAVMAPTRWLPPIEHQIVLLLQILMTFGAVWVVRRFSRSSSEEPPAGAPAGQPTRYLLAATAGLLLALPWLAAGTLGSMLDVLLAALLALALGVLAWALLQLDWVPTLRLDSRGPRRDRFTGGLVIGILLLILASGVSLNGVQILLMLVLPATAWAVLASGAPLLATALAAAAPLLLVDPDVVNIIALDPLLFAYFGAAGSGVVLGWLLGLVGVLPRATLHRRLSRGAAAGLLLASALVAGAVYWGAGQPGFYGDRLFVVLDEQADLAAAAALPEPADRREAVYTTLVAHAGASQADLRRTLDRLRLDYTPYYLVNALEVEGGLLLRLWLTLRPEVDRVLPSPVLRPVADSLEQTAGDEPAPETPPWNVTTIGADRVWREFEVRGQGIVVGQSDSGVQVDHPALADSYRGRDTGHDYNWFDPWYHSPMPVDYSGHGTHTLGTVLGEEVGVAPDATWIACANLVRNLGNPALYLDCMQFMLAPFPLDGDPLRDGEPALGAQVLNNSWGCPYAFEGCDAQVFAPAVSALRTAGLFVVASAGNSGPLCGSINDPIAIYAETLTVGAVDRSGDLAVFSSTGPVTVDGSVRTKPDLAAPGVDVLSAYPGSTYALASGTSMAGPHVAGVVALMWSANPALVGAVDQTEALLLEAAVPFRGWLAPALSATEQAELAETFGDDSPVMDLLVPAINPEACLLAIQTEETPNNAVGYGIVDAYRAVELARAATPAQAAAR